MSKQYSIAEARANLPSVVDEAASGVGVELTRRGKPVAVMLSVEQYESLVGKRASFKSTYRRHLERYPLSEVGLEPGFLRGVRGRKSGREVKL